MLDVFQTGLKDFVDLQKYIVDVIIAELVEQMSDIVYAFVLVFG